MPDSILFGSTPNPACLASETSTAFQTGNARRYLF